MKKYIGLFSCILVSLLCVGFLLGFYLGRNGAGSDVHISKLPSQPVSSDATDESLPQIEVVNINTATLDQLQTLPGIGPVLAQRIIDYREANGPFKNPADLAQVEDIGKKRLEAILDYITTGG